MADSICQTLIWITVIAASAVIVLKVIDKLFEAWTIKMRCSSENKTAKVVDSMTESGTDCTGDE